MKLVTAAQMHTCEQMAVDAGVSLDALMEAAGLAVAQEAWLSLGVIAGRRVVVLCGAGNNGGDGLVAARHLADWEAEVALYLLAPREGDPNLAKLTERNVPVFVIADDAVFASLAEALAHAEVIVDALLGTGRSRAIEGTLARVLARVHHASERRPPPQIIAVDLPTGVDADSGAADVLAINADTTVTLGFAKAGLYTLPGSRHAGNVQVVDIGIPASAADELTVELLSSAWVRDRLPARPIDGNKGTFGRVLVVAGSSEYVGAARLAAEACYRVGAGLVTISCPARLQASIAPALPEATYLLLPGEHALDEASAERIVERLPSFDVLLIGPGIGQHAGVREAVRRILSAAPDGLRACVIDADALNALAATDGWAEKLPANSVLTPHPGEMARLLASTVADVQADRLGCAMRAAAEWRQAVVLKGAHTIVAGADGRAAVNPHVNPLLATAGTGDVLAGTIAGLIAQGLSPYDAASAGVYLHALAAEEAGEDVSDRGLIASDLLPALPRAIRTIREGKRMPRIELPFGQ